MTDAQRSYNMSRIRGKDTSIEKALSRALWHRGLRFQKNSSSVYGHPDISVVNCLQDEPKGLDVGVPSKDSVSGFSLAPHPSG